jgi:hypothetical protein
LYPPCLTQEKTVLLSQRIGDKERRIHQEAQALIRIKQELALIDKDLMKDVAILQGEISEESRCITDLEGEFAVRLRFFVFVFSRSFNAYILMKVSGSDR